jgi:hypothetical protein
MSVFRSGLLNRRILKKVPRVQLSPSPPIWFRVREARCGSAKPATLVRVQSEPQQLAEMAELAMHHLAKVDHAGSSPVLRSMFFATVHRWPRGWAPAFQAGYAGSSPVRCSIFAPKACVVMRQFRKLEN